MDKSVFSGVMPALMTPCDADRRPDMAALAAKGRELVDLGMSAVVYCGSMGDWPLLSEEERMSGVEALVAAGLPVVVGTGALNTAQAVRLAAHAAKVGAAGLMLIPRVLSRGPVVAAQKAHFSAILAAAPDLPAVIYNSPYYGFATDAALFFALRAGHPNLVGFKEFGGAAALSYAAQHITSGDPALTLMVGVDTQVFHGYVNCGATGAITGIGNALPREVLQLEALCRAAAAGDATARRRAQELDEAMQVLSSFDAGPDLVLVYKYLLHLNGDAGYDRHFVATDALSPAQAAYVETQYRLFRDWYRDWAAAPAEPELA